MGARWSRNWIRAVSATALLPRHAGDCAGQPAPIGEAWQRTTTPIGGQALPAAAIDGTGRAVVVWKSSETVTNFIVLSYVFSRRLDLRGPLAPEVAGFASCVVPVRPRVAAAASGDFMMVWESGLDNCWDYNYAPRILVRRHGDGGAGDGVERTIERSAGVSSPEIAMTPAGESIVVWSSSGRIAASLLASDLSSSGKLHLASGAAGSNPAV